MNSLTDPIVVLGCFRSGTSSVSLALSTLGAYFGEPGDFNPPDEWNQEGYWEHLPVMAVNRAILNTLNVPQFDIDFFPSNWMDFPPTQRLFEDYRAVLAKHFSGKPVWGWKDPETALIVPLVKEALRLEGVRGRYVICVRNPVEVAESEFRRISFDRMLSIGSWMQHVLQALSFTKGEKRAVVMFNDWVEDPKAVLEQIVEMVGDWHPSEQQWREAAGTRRKELVHVRRPDTALEGLPDLISRTYQLCREAACDQRALREGVFDERIDAIDREYRAWLAILRLQDQPRGALRVEWPEGVAPKSLTEMYSGARSWQRIGIDVPCPAGARLAVSLYQAIGTIWIRESTWVVGGQRFPAQFRPGRHAEISDDRGIPWVWPRYGTEQLVMQAPAGPGPYRLEFEILLSTGEMARKRMWQALSERLDKATMAPRIFR